MTIKELRKGDYFRTINRKGEESKCIYVRGDYDRSTRTFSASKFSDYNDERFFKPDQLVSVDFYF